MKIRPLIVPPNEKHPEEEIDLVPTPELTAAEWHSFLTSNHSDPAGTSFECDVRFLSNVCTSKNV